MALQGFVYYHGPSMIDGNPVVAIMTGLSSPSPNTKTGPMIQGYFLNPESSPLSAARVGDDERICGSCRHRGKIVTVDGVTKNTERSCYVTLFQGPSVVYRSFRSGSYPVLFPDEARSLLADKTIRLGAYGDPASIPSNILHHVMELSRGHTGYTHLWRDRPELSDILMASCDTPEERIQAKSLGYRTFRVRVPDEPVLDGEGQCPASGEMGKVTTCDQCLLCDGSKRNLRTDITLLGHGSGAVNFQKSRMEERV